MSGEPDYIADGIAGVSALIALTSIFIAKAAATRSEAAQEKSEKAHTKIEEAVKKANEVVALAALAATELDIRAMLSSRRDKMNDVARDLEAITKGRAPDKLSDDEKQHVAVVYTRLVSVHEDVLNAYEEACAKYRDKKVDVTRFKKSYHGELRTVVEAKEGHPFYKFLHPEGTSAFKAIWTVYKEWNDLENAKD